MVRPFAFHPAVPFAEQDFQTFATRAVFSTDGLDQEQLAYCSKATFQLVKAEKFSKAAVASSAFGFDASKGEPMIESMANVGSAEEVECVDDDVESADLYKGSFSLAFGTCTLLRETKLYLKKDKFHNLLGPTTCGKTTLMRAISEEKVEDFPKRDELITIHGTHDVAERELEPPNQEWRTEKRTVDLTGWQFAVYIVNNVCHEDRNRGISNPDSR